jgi:hypothetical protein
MGRFWTWPCNTSRGVAAYWRQRANNVQLWLQTTLMPRIVRQSASHFG